MERLTEKSKSGMVWFIDRENNDTRLEPCEMDSHHSRLAIQKLAEYEDLEEQGLLLKLPCKVGDAIYEVIENGDIVKYKITGISINDTNMCFIYGEGRYKEGEGEKYYGKFLPSEFGKNVFLTKEEVEEKLKELRGGKVEEGYT